MSRSNFSSFDQFFEIECVAENITDTEWIDSLRAMPTERIARYITRYGRLSTKSLCVLRETVAERCAQGEAAAEAVLAEIDRQLAEP